MGELAIHAVDVVLSDAPAGSGMPVRTFSHPLGECGSSFFAAPQLARRFRRGFPHSLDGAPALLPNSESTFRRALDSWFKARDIRPEVIAELDDLALASVLGETALGVIAAPDAIEQELRRRYGLQLVGRAKEIRQRFFAISVERKITNPGVAAICEVARKKIFA
jgi:LysR family transcriptional activator of nhaA